MEPEERNLGTGTFERQAQVIHERAQTWLNSIPQCEERPILPPNWEIDLLNIVLSISYVTCLRYRQHYLETCATENAMHASTILQQAHDELSHAKKIADLIFRLGGEAHFQPDSRLVSRSHRVKPLALQEAMAENIAAHKTLITIYAELTHFCRWGNVAVRELIEDLLGAEMDQRASITVLAKQLVPSAPPSPKLPRRHLRLCEPPL